MLCIRGALFQVGGTRGSESAHEVEKGGEVEGFGEGGDVGGGERGGIGAEQIGGGGGDDHGQGKRGVVGRGAQGTQQGQAIVQGAAAHEVKEQQVGRVIM